MNNGANWKTLAFLGIVFVTLPVTLRAEDPLRIGEAEGALYDGILDGYPGVALFDGTPDLTDNPPSVALKFGVLEMRTVAEFPLDRVAGTNPRSATLVFNIDDVITTFGPGADFSGRAASRILLHAYCADGQIALADFLATARDPWTIDTTSHGTITDATLARSGPVVFALDVTATVRELLRDGCPWLGIVFRTLDNNTATSLDDLGDGGSYGGTKGANGAFLPYLELELAAPSPTLPPTATPTPTATATITPEPTATQRAEPPTPSPTATPHASIPPCGGDCDGDREVTISEILALVRIALELDPRDQCPAADADDDTLVTVTDIVLAVQHALAGCPAAERN